MVDGPSFTIPSRPQRNYPFSGGLEYEGGTTFELVPGGEWNTSQLETLLASVLSEGPYRYGDFLNLPMTLYLVKDQQTGDVFRVSIRDGNVRLHVLPETNSEGLRALYRRLTEATDTEWNVTVTVEQ